MKFLMLAILAFALAQAGCEHKEKKQQTQAGSTEMPLPTKAQPKMQTLRLWLGAEELVTELALTPDQRQAGMMFRQGIGENEGMLFVFPVPHQTAFWMKNVSVPLSVAYIDPSGVILEIHDLHPHNTNSVVANSDRIQYVLETSQGWFKRHNVGTGTVVRTEHGALSSTFTTSSGASR